MDEARGLSLPRQSPRVTAGLHNPGTRHPSWMLPGLGHREPSLGDNVMQLFYVTRDRFKIVHEDIANGSEPALRFYLMVAVSTLIASFGLISDSTAVVIGAMLVAPLMTPIFGIALALVRGETGLLGRALRAEIMGVLAALAMSFVLGSLIGHYEPTGEMLARTRPNLFDLLVAVLAGFAGTYALIDEKISPALPGVAIATAIVPPLANSGLCLALGEVEGGIGSFLLFSPTSCPSSWWPPLPSFSAAWPSITAPR